MLEVPEELHHIWQYFLDLSRKRTGNGFGPNPLAYSEILAYFSVHRIEYDELDVLVIDLLDSIAMEHFAEEAEKENNKNKSKKKS